MDSEVREDEVKKGKFGSPRLFYLGLALIALYIINTEHPSPKEDKSN